MDNGVVGDFGEFGIGRRWTLEEERTVNKHPPLHGVILLDDLCMNEGDEEDGRKNAKPTADAHGDGSNVPGWFLIQPKIGRALVHYGERTDGTGDEEEERRGVDGPWNGVASQVHSELDKHKDGCGKASGDCRSHS